MCVSIMLHERFWSLESWKRQRLFRTYFFGGFSIGPVIFEFGEF